ncbi:MAG: molecular chaperone TorD family protein [Beijerinckiaceae bacterium]|nr:molecular chaperone TorD family protein [Beijerinckiaceae bacterium]MCZ8301017.1 molecular chaperone TorD family protein [Beijerinckiaceae bacterium]
MRDAGLQEAIRAVGGISALSRLLGIAQPSVSIWTRVPAERVIAVENVTSVPRHILRPDLYPDSCDAPPLDAIDEARSRLYLLLSHLLLKVPDERVLIDLRRLQGDDSALGQALMALADAADVPGADRIAREHFDLFIGVGRGELLPYASYYLTGFLYERPLVRVRQDMRRLGVERSEGMSEPEDHLGFLLETMAGLIARRFAAEVTEQNRFFARHIEPWAERFFADLAKADAANFYRKVGALGLEFIRIEREAFDLDPDVTELSDAIDASQGASA